ncbi:TadE/TadG family type IV pilus assembly protein [Enterovirga rhinocerotis]|uniref:TadE-like protein n=1 Tax=Enterovirga rhinocerotis TaxID=1339210 RepID=A0A4R7BX62_9HYPH|nr:TadE/TadG family type IV pilus assembly protein [Enterovirga rhinocerotis]TDR90494.1 TadE-like protein [Enterovirga rhinocerotis]
MRCNAGASAVEFALVSPILIVMLFGIIAYGLYFAAAHSLQQIAAEAARASVAGLSDAERRELARRSVSLALAPPSLLRAEHVTLQFGTDAADPYVYIVSLSFDARVLGIAPLAEIIPVPNLVLTKSARVRRGGL